MTTLCVVPGIEPFGANASHRMHWMKRKRERTRILEHLFFAWLNQAKGTEFTGKVRVEYQRSYRSKPMDEDNLSYSFKAVGDALVKSKILSDDSPDLLHLVCSQVKRTPGKGPYFAIAITPITD